ncbi:DUF6499 domain-containing protein [Mesorhizobium sp. YR577]|uniref:transcriptional regulator domain-containing protein n=1 Tax=Mesorhizobium sp. YR577 TaxID=1884373 RepID=UPI000A4403AB|nr:DUF6499 domain-containing protein [Mesorhizobium sp. YR577]
MKPDSSQWRSSTAYEFIKDASADAVAWEFLRRNPQYQSDFACFRRKGSDMPAQSIETMRQRWGLRFRRKPGSTRD